MPVQHVLWKIGKSPERLLASRLDSEKQLEEMIVAEPSILSRDWMLIGRQERTAYGKILDLLAVAPDGSLVLIELKRDQTPWDVVAQALDYASWVEELEPEQIAEIYRRFKTGSDLTVDFRTHFGIDLDEDQLNGSHQIVIVAAEMDEATERITRYLTKRDVPINVLFFRVFESGNDKLLSRVWLTDPGDTQPDTVVVDNGKKQPWNGEYYVSYGGYSWNDAREYGLPTASGKVGAHGGAVEDVLSALGAPALTFGRGCSYRSPQAVGDGGMPRVAARCTTDPAFPRERRA